MVVVLKVCFQDTSLQLLIHTMARVKVLSTIYVPKPKAY